MNAPDVTAAVQTPAPAEHPSVSAPKCIDCKHHRARHGSTAFRPRDLCAHPRYSRSLITGEPNQTCADLRGAQMVSADGLPPCGPAGTLFEAADDQGGPVVTRTELAAALRGVLAVLDDATVIEQLVDEPCKASPRVMRARHLLQQLDREVQA